MADKLIKYRPAHSTEKDLKRGSSDVVQKPDRDKAVADANTPKTARMATVEGPVSPKLNPTQKAGPSAPTLVVISPQSAPAKDATGMMASKPVAMPVPNVAVKTSNPNITNPQGLRDFKAEEYAKAQLAAKQAQGPAPAIPEPWYGKASDAVAPAMFGPIGNEALQRALEAVRKHKVGKQ